MYIDSLEMSFWAQRIENDRRIALKKSQQIKNYIKTKINVSPGLVALFTERQKLLK